MYGEVCFGKRRHNKRQTGIGNVLIFVSWVPKPGNLTSRMWDRLLRRASLMSTRPVGDSGNYPAPLCLHCPKFWIIIISTVRNSIGCISGRSCTQYYTVCNSTSINDSRSIGLLRCSLCMSQKAGIKNFTHCAL
jgi:hypothetical protein